MSLLKPLLSVVESLLHEHEQLLTLANRKKDILIKGDMQALNDLVKEELGCVQRVERLEGERLGAGRLLAARLGLAVDQLTAERVIALASDEAEATQMQALTERLRSTVNELQKQNDLNKQLIEQSLQFVRLSVDLLSESPLVPTYGGTGATNEPYSTGKTSYFDSKA
ncbi:MAG TPA: flagellar protein FlgN [Bacilli bacterium]|nr:flagellar protein FlgN [Bacilli bacterium]